MVFFKLFQAIRLDFHVFLRPKYRFQQKTNPNKPNFSFVLCSSYLKFVQSTRQKTMDYKPQNNYSAVLCRIKSFPKPADIYLLVTCRTFRSTKMVFKYMVADTDLVNGRVAKPENQNVEITKAPTPTPPPKKSLSPIKKKVVSCLLLTVNVALSFYLYNHLAP